MVSVPTIGPKVCVLKPAEGDGVLRAIKIYNMSYFGREVKPSAQCQDFTTC
jgi:hypothetical protein